MIRRLTLACAMAFLVACAAQKPALVLPSLGERASATDHDGMVCYDPYNAKLLRANLLTLQAQIDAMTATLAAAGVEVTYQPAR